MKSTVKRMKGQATDWEKIFANHISDEVFISRIYKELSKLNKEKTNYLKWGKDLNRHFTKEDIQWKIST